MNIQRTLIYIALFFLVVPTAYYVGSIYAVSGDATLCARQRGDMRCNTDSDCCPGRECDSFQFCVRKR